MAAKTHSHFVDGLQLPVAFVAENVRSAVNYQIRPGDVYLVTFPKCGTTWTSNIVIHILQKGQPMEKPADMHAKSPFIEMTGAKYVEDATGPIIIKTHLPLHMTPWSDKAKYIYVTRNPKDCCVSYYHHVKNIPHHEYTGTFDEFFELFVTGQTDYGDYFDHLLAWYERRNEPNVLLLTYEDLKKDIDSAILKMASFMDDEKYADPIRKNPEIMNKIKFYSSFKEMKQFMAKGFEDMMSMSEKDLDKSNLPGAMKKFILEASKKTKEKTGQKDAPDMSQFVRKGITGDWKNYFSEDQSRRLDAKCAKRMQGTDLYNFWKEYM